MTCHSLNRVTQIALTLHNLNKTCPPSKHNQMLWNGSCACFKIAICQHGCRATTSLQAEHTALHVRGLLKVQIHSQRPKSHDPFQSTLTSCAEGSNRGLTADSCKESHAPIHLQNQKRGLTMLCPVNKSDLQHTCMLVWQVHMQE